MAEYYGYAERDANSYVDWGKLGQNLTETVQAAYKIREDRKAELDKLMQENYAEVANSPTGLNQDINGATAKYVDDTKRFLLQANKMLKAGILQPKDYMLINQNLSEDTKALYSNVKNWQTAWAKIQDDVITNKGSSAMLDIAEQVSSFGKFKNLDLMINPVTGRLNASKMNKGPNGELIKGESLSMQQLNVLMNQDIPRYDLTATLKKNEEALGTFINSTLVKGAIQKQGSIINVEDKAVKNTFTAAKEGFIKEVMANDFNVLSILKDQIKAVPGKDGKDIAYKVSTDPNEKGPNIIKYVDPDGDGSYTPEFTPEQKKAAEDFITARFIGMIDRKETSQIVSQLSEPSEASIQREDLQKQKDAAVGAWDKLRSGTAEEKKAAANTILGTTIAQDAGLLDVDLTTRPGFVTLIYKDPIKNREIEITENGADWSAIGVEVHKENDVNKAKKAAGNSWAKPINKDYTGVRAKRQGNDFAAEMSQYTGQNVPNSIIEDDYAATAENLNNKFKDLGFTVDGDYDMGLTGASDYIIITAPDGSKSKKIYIDNLDNVSEIEAFLVSKIDNTKAGRFFSTIGKPASSGQQAGQQGELD